MPTTLLGLPYSPWTEKARFALDLRRVPYTFRTYQPLLGEPALRIAQRKLTGPVSVPVLTTDEGTVVADSTQIARWADWRGEGTPLFPVEHDAEIHRVIALGERALSAGRALALQRMLEDREALMEMVPKPIARTVGPRAATIAALGIHRTLRKYRLAGVPHDEHVRALEEGLDDVRAMLARRSSGATADPPTLLGTFTFADIAASQSLSFIAPPARGIRIGRASRRAFTDVGFSERYADLIAWRDALYGRWRVEPVGVA